MINTISVIVIIIEALLIVTYLIYGFKTKTIIDKKNLIYTLPVFLVMFVLYIVGAVYTKNEFTFSDISEAAVSSIEAFAFKFNKEFIESALNDSISYKISIYSGTIICGYTLISAFSGLFKIRIYNWIASYIHIKFRDGEIVIGNSPNALIYAENNKKTCVLLLDSSTINDKRIINTEELYKKGVVFLVAKVDSKKINSLIRKYKKDIDFVVFGLDSKKAKSLYNIIENTNDCGHIVNYHVEAPSFDTINFLDRELSSRAKKRTNVVASAFSIHDIMGLEFSKYHNLAYYLPKGWINDAVIDSNKTINVFFLGAGKTNTSIFKSALLNNQFVTIEDGKFKAFKINYYLYEKKDEELSRDVFNFVCNYDETKKDSSGTLDYPESTFIFNHLNCDIKSSEFIKKFKEKVSDSSSVNTFNFVFVSLGDDFINADLADDLCRILPKENGVVFYNQDFGDLVSEVSYNKPISYGNKDRILRRNIILNDTLRSLAERRHLDYTESKKEFIKYSSLPIIEKLSNAYSEINLGFKLSLLNLRVGRSNGISKEEFNLIYHQNKEVSKYKYDDYRNLTIRNALVYQEHLRWCLFYLMNEYTPYSFDKIHVDEKGKIIHKDISKKEHACLTSFEGLDVLHKKEAMLLSDDSNFREVLADVETYKWDAFIMDNIYDNLTNM